MPEVANNKWAPISSIPSIVMNNEEGTTLKIPMGFYKIQMFCTMLQGGQTPENTTEDLDGGTHRHP